MNELIERLILELGEYNASEQRKVFLSQKIQSAIERLKDNGAVGKEPYSQLDKDLIVDYANFLINNRDTQNGIPDYMRWAINNRIIQRRTENV